MLRLHSKRSVKNYSPLKLRSRRANRMHDAAKTTAESASVKARSRADSKSPVAKVALVVAASRRPGPDMERNASVARVPPLASDARMDGRKIEKKMLRVPVHKPTTS